MYKLSVVGIDNCGKTSVVRSLDQIEGVEVIHATTDRTRRDYERIMPISSRIMGELARRGESFNLKSVTGLMYLLHLIPYYVQDRRDSSPVFVSDRDPIVDTMCYSDFYLPKGLPRLVRPPLRRILEGSFSYPDAFCYLEVSPEVSIRRNDKPPQLHDTLDRLRKLRDLFEEEMSLAESKGIPVIRIETDQRSLEEVTAEVRTHVEEVLN